MLATLGLSNTSSTRIFTQFPYFPENAPPMLAGAINLILAVLIFIGFIKDTEVDVGFRAGVSAQSTLASDYCICALRSTQLPWIRLSRVLRKSTESGQVNTDEMKTKPTKRQGVDNSKSRRGAATKTLP